MIRNTEEIFKKLVNGISLTGQVQSIGISGGKTPLPQAGEGDIDIFIYCDTIPEAIERQTILSKMGSLLSSCRICTLNGGHWGSGDFASINGVETWMMYFTTAETLSDVEAILAGKYPDKLDNYYYPIGRCAMFRGMDILFDRNGFLSSLKERLAEYPDKLAETITAYHMKSLEDTEDLERAAARSDVLFYHFAMDIALDHFLQALFAVNKTFFPSRKRTFNYVRNFKLVPEKCEERLLEVIKSGSTPEGISQSFALWVELVNELLHI